MDGTGNQNSPQTPQTPNGSQTPQRPDFVEERHWDPTAGAIKAEPLARDYAESRKKINQGVEAYKAEFEKTRFKDRPEKPEAYAIGDRAELEGGLVILGKDPGQDFKPEQGKRYFVAKDDHPLMGFWRKHAWEQGLGADAFQKGVAAFAGAQVAMTQAAEKQQAEWQAAELAKLGEHGKARVDHVTNKLTAMIGAEAVKVMDIAYMPAAAIQGLEAILEKAGEPKFAPGSGSTGGAQMTDAQLKAIMAEPDYYQNPEKQARVAAGYQQLYKGPAPNGPAQVQR